MTLYILSCTFFFFNDTATTEIYTLSLHDALPIFHVQIVFFTTTTGSEKPPSLYRVAILAKSGERPAVLGYRDRKSTRLNSSHGYISYAVFCLKKKKKSKTRCRNPGTRP